jgi:hypothetical protein
MFRIEDNAFARTLIDHLDLDEKKKETDFDFRKGDKSGTRFFRCVCFQSVLGMRKICDYAARNVHKLV